MSGLRGAILSLFGLTVAIAAALIVLPIVSLLDPVTRQAGTAFAHFAFFSLADAGLAGSPEFPAAELARFVWTVLVSVCVIPLVITVLIGAAARVHSLLWYAGVTGFMAALAPWVARAVLRGAGAAVASPEELRFAFIFFLTGAASGFVFWILADRDGEAERRRPN
jgi:hypothetical protein